jgi:hypothetical protein
LDFVPADADARHDDVSKIGIKVLVLLATLCVAGTPLYADGGTLQFQKQAGPFTVTLFSMPVPVRVGAADLSVLVQDSQNNTLVDGRVTVHLSKADERDIVAVATTAQATNKLLYAAPVELPKAGKWHVRIDVARAGLSGEAEGEIDVLPEEPPLEAFWTYFAIVPFGVLLFVLNQWLKRREHRLKK